MKQARRRSSLFNGLQFPDSFALGSVLHGPSSPKTTSIDGVGAFFGTLRRFSVRRCLWNAAVHGVRSQMDCRLQEMTRARTCIHAVARRVC